MQISLLLGMITKAAWEDPAEEMNILTNIYGVKRLKSSLDFKCYVNTYLILGGFGLDEVPFRKVRGPSLL